MIHTGKSHSHAVVGIAILFVLIFSFSTAAPVYADSVITNCANDAQLTAALASGGNITFNCGTATLTLTSYYFIGVDTTIDGGGKITLSGGNSTRLF